MPIFYVEAIEPSQFSLDGVRLEILNALRKEGRTDRRELRKTVKDWRGAKPDFPFKIGLTKDTASVRTGPKGSPRAVNKWRWLNGGTRIRWALMSGNWQSKTRVRSFGTGPGRGRVVVRGRKAMSSRGISPRRGIDAREWIPELIKKRKGPFVKSIQVAVNKGINKMYRRKGT